MAKWKESVTGSHQHSSFVRFCGQEAERSIHIGLVVVSAIVLNCWNRKAEPRTLGNMLAVRQCNAFLGHYLSRQTSKNDRMASKTFPNCTIQMV
jgi:hypothetical protein